MKPYIDALQKVDQGQIYRIAERLNTTASLNGRIFVAGNGGSHAVAQHFASDLMKPVGAEHLEELSVINLSDNMAFLTAVGNDLGFDEVFAKAAEVHGIYNQDTLVVFSVSGTSPNIEKLVFFDHTFLLEQNAFLRLPLEQICPSSQASNRRFEVHFERG